MFALETETQYRQYHTMYFVYIKKNCMFPFLHNTPIQGEKERKGGGAVVGEGLGGV